MMTTATTLWNDINCNTVAFCACVLELKLHLKIFVKFSAIFVRTAHGG